MALPRLQYNPALTPEPEFNSEIFRDTRDALVQALHLTEEEATGRIRQQWLDQQAVLTARWNAQELADEEERQRTQLERDQALAAEREAEDEARREAEKKKPKFPQVTRGAPLQIRTTDRIPEAVRAKLRKLEYVPLYPFTREGMAAAKDESYALNDDVYTIAKTEDGGIGLKPATSKGIERVKRDRDITFAQFHEAWNLLVRGMRENDWPEDVTQMFTDFFYQLANHENRHQTPYELHDRALLLYADEARRDWHDEVAKHGKALDLAVIQPDRLNACFTRVEKEYNFRSERERYVSHLGSQLSRHTD